MVCRIWIVVCDLLQGTTPGDHIGVVTFSTIQNIAASTREETIPASSTIKDIVARTSIENVITVATMERVISISTCQHIIEEATIKKIVSVQPLDAVDHVSKATKGVITCCCSAHDNPISELSVTPNDTV